MKSVRGIFAIATQLIGLLCLLVLTVPRTCAQEKGKTVEEQDSAQKSSSDQRPAARPERKAPPRGDADKKPVAGTSRDSGARQAARPSSDATAPNGTGDGSSRATRGGRGAAGSASGHAAPSLETAQDAPEEPEEKPATRGPQNGSPRQPRSAGDPATASSRPSRNAQAGRGSSANNPAQPASPAEAENGTGPSTDKPVRTSPWSGKPNPATSRPGRAGTPAEASDNGKPAPNIPAGRRASGKPAAKPAESANADAKGSAADRKSNRSKAVFSRSTRANGTVVERDKTGKTRAVTTTRGTTATLNDRGQVTAIRDKKGNTINRGPRGERKVETVRADRTRVVSFGRRGGYVERPLYRGGRQYLQRTYVVGGISYVHVYRGYHYHGRPYFVYVPPYYYAPAYYGWVFNPWPRPIYYSWGWFGSPWYRPYGYYFAPYPVYPYASLWLTDYLIAENLRLAYENDQLSAGAEQNTAQFSLASYRPNPQAKTDQPAVLTPEVKQMIADKVKAVIAEQQASAGSAGSNAGADDAMPPALDPRQRVFVAFSVVEADADGDTCSLTSSDVIQRAEDVPDEDNTVAVRVLASKNSDCAIGSTVRVELSDLIDMENHLREQVDAGLKILTEKQGTGGLPAAPAANPRAVAEGMAALDPAAAADLRRQELDADQTEKEVEGEAVNSDSSN